MELVALLTLIIWFSMGSADYMDRLGLVTRGFDGFFNNPSHPQWGSVGEQIESYYGSVSYADGIQKIADGPPAREVSTTFLRTPNDGKARNSKVYTALFPHFAQLIYHEIVDCTEASCPREIIGIDVSDDPIFSRGRSPDEMIKMPLYRSLYDKSTGQFAGNPRKQLNMATSWVDGSFIYGTSEIVTDNMRKFEGGCLNLDERGLPPLNKKKIHFDNFPPPRTHERAKTESFWVIGSQRGHENPAMLSLSIMWMRYHNAIAKEIVNQYPNITDQDAFTLTRNKVIAVLQSVIYYEWLPELLGTTEGIEFTQFKPSTAPYIDSLYATVSSQWFMTLIPPGIVLRNVPENSKAVTPECTTKSVLRLCETWFDGQYLINNSESDMVKEMILGLAAQPAEAEDNFIVEDLLDYHYGPLHFSRMDRAAMQIVHARDFGVKFGEIFNTFSNESRTWSAVFKALGINALYQEKLRSVYVGEDPAMVDTLIFSLLERGEPPQGPGKLTKMVIRDQLLRIRDADYNWFENRRNGLFDPDEIAEIKRTKLHDVIRKAFAYLPDATNMFTQVNEVCKLPAVKLEDLPPCSPLKTFDYFAGNEFAYIISFVFLGIFPFIVIGVAYGVYKLQVYLNNRKASQESRPNLAATMYAISNVGRESLNPDTDSIVVNEWIGPDEITTVNISFGSDKYALYVKGLDGVATRSVNLAVYEVVTLFIYPNYPYVVLIEIPKAYDLVLHFTNNHMLTEFCQCLSTYIKNHQKLMVRQPATWKEIKKRAITKAKRKERLDSFFRNVFAQAFSMDSSSQQSLHDGGMPTSREIVEFEISKEEFADCLGMKPNSQFVAQMFALSDKHNRGFLRYREILELVIVMSKGSPDRKLELLFDMFDFQKDGLIQRHEVSCLVRSLVDLAGSKVPETDLDNLISEMFAVAGLDENSPLDFEGFKRLLNSKDKDFMAKVGVDWKGVKKRTRKGRSRKQKMDTLTLSPMKDDANSLQSILRSRQSIKRLTGHSSAPESTVTTPTTPSVEGTRRVGFVNTAEEEKDSRRPLARSASLALAPQRPKFNPRRAKWTKFIHYIENRKREIAVLFFFYAICIGLFLSKFHEYYVAKEHIGARGTLSLGVPFARGAAEVISFTFSMMMLTMCYNLVRYLRETFVNLYIPFDKNIVFHKIIAWTAAFFTAVHSIAYGFNYYFLAAGPPSHACFFDELYYPSDGFIRVGKTLYTTIPGITGVLMILVLTVMFVFASQTARRYMHQTFWLSHKLFIGLYVMMGMHGLLWLTQKPNFWYHFCGPVLLYLCDKLISVTRRKIELKIVKAELLPSNVLAVMFRRPPSFEYKSGMWLRIACDAVGAHEYHPFTITSAPHEDTLSLHIRAVGPWTKNIRTVIGNCLKTSSELPTVFVDGPFGSGQQDWYNFEVSVLVGAGIGVTPYASILKDFVHMMRTKNRFRIKCQKVYFIWSTSNQRSFEWLLDILKQVEEVDINNTVSANIFITQFFQSFDLRTSMLYVFEEHAKRLGGCSLFTGLQATTNFGRPKFEEIFQKITEGHPRVKNIGVFSCGPPGITKGVEGACIKTSASTRASFQHHYENF